MSCLGMYVTICKILLLLFCIWISHISLSNYFVLILKFYTVPVRLRSVTNFVNHETLQCKHVSKFFTAENMTSFINYVTATLRALFAWRGSINDQAGLDFSNWSQAVIPYPNWLFVYCLFNDLVSVSSEYWILITRPFQLHIIDK